MIPKIIHFCWFGKKSYPDLINDCINSWETVLPDYNIIRWDEQNSILDCAFAKDAYRANNWAFVSDYIRLVVLYEMGGIYLDTDMMLIKSFNDLLDNECFLGFENEETVSAGVIGVKPKNSYIKKCIEYYKKSQYNESDLTPIPQVLTNILSDNHKIQYSEGSTIIQGVTIYPIRYFYPLPYYEPPELYNKYVVNETYAVHLWNHSWANEFNLFWKDQYKAGLKKAIKRITRNPFQPFTYYKDLFFHLLRLLKAILKIST